METTLIKGQCPDCGRFFVGTVDFKDGIFQSIHCPSCGEAVDNFDNAKVVDALNADECDDDELPVYHPAKLQLYA